MYNLFNPLFFIQWQFDSSLLEGNSLFFFLFLSLNFFKFSLFSLPLHFFLHLPVMNRLKLNESLIWNPKLFQYSDILALNRFMNGHSIYKCTDFLIRSFLISSLFLSTSAFSFSDSASYSSSDISSNLCLSFSSFSFSWRSENKIPYPNNLNFS